jgi:5-formyltetrahydrofolate cyclo-ligase
MACKKSILRKKYAKIRKTINIREKIQYDHQIISLLAKLLIKAQKIAIFHPKFSEINLLNLLNNYQDKQFLLPRINHDILDFYHVNSGDQLDYHLKYKLYEPKIHYPQMIPEIIICPLLAFDKNKHRLGYGGGYYDRTLSILKEQQPKLTTIGVAYNLQEHHLIPNLAHDISLDFIATETKIL